MWYRDSDRVKLCVLCIISYEPFRRLLIPFLSVLSQQEVCLHGQMKSLSCVLSTVSAGEGLELKPDNWSWFKWSVSSCPRSLSLMSPVSLLGSVTQPLATYLTAICSACSQLFALSVTLISSHNRLEKTKNSVIGRDFPTKPMTSWVLFHVNDSSPVQAAVRCWFLQVPVTIITLTSLNLSLNRVCEPFRGRVTAGVWLMTPRSQ